MKKLFMLCMAGLLTASTALAQSYRLWDFRHWSSQTVSNLMAEAAKGYTEGLWSDQENATGSAVTKDISPNNCFWQVGNSSGGIQLTANGVTIAETEGLTFVNTKARALAIAVNYGDCTSANGAGFGPYHGGSYLWLGSSKQDYFVIPGVAPGTVIKMGVESHKITDARGVELYVYTGNSKGDKLTAPDGSAVGVPKEYDELEWIVPTDAAGQKDDGTYDVLVYNTNGCHIYFIEVGDNSKKPRVAYLYGTSEPDDDLGYIYASGSDKFDIEGVAATGTLSFDELTAYDAIVISSTVTDAAAISALKTIHPFVPTLNLNAALYQAWGYGSAVSADTPFVDLKDPQNKLFGNLELIPDTDREGVMVLQLTNSVGFEAVTLEDRFAADNVLAVPYANDAAVAIHTHNMNHNGYLYVPYSQDALADVASPALVENAIVVVAASKAKISQAPKPAVSLEYKDRLTVVTLKSTVTGAQVFYTLDGTEPTTASNLYTEPLSITTEGVTLKAVALGDGYLMSDVVELAVDLKSQAPQPTIQTEQQSGKTVVTLATTLDGAAIYYNYNGNTTTAASGKYTEPLVVTQPGRTLYAFTVASGYVDSEVARLAIPVSDARVRIDVLAHMDAAKDVYFAKDNESTSTPRYYFSWGKDKAGYPYYNTEEGVTQETVTDPESGLESTVTTYSILNPEEELDFENGWMIRSRGQLVIWESADTRTDVGDTSYRNPATVEDMNPDFPVTNHFLNLADKNTMPNDGQTFPYNAYIISTVKYQGPFDIVANIGNGAGDESQLNVVLQVAADGNAWDSSWQVLGDTINIVNGRRLYHNVTRSYEGTDEVYVRAYLANGNSKAQFYDIYIANAGELSQQRLEEAAGISEQQPTATRVVEACYSINGTRHAGLQPGVNIVRYADGSTRKVLKRK